HLLSGMFAREERYVRMDGSRLSAMGWYTLQFETWEPEVIDTPTLLLRATEPLNGMTDDPESEDWKASWAFARRLAVADVPGDHFTMTEEHLGATVRSIQDWIATL